MERQILLILVKTQINLSKYTSKTTKTPKFRKLILKICLACLYKNKKKAIIEKSSESSLTFNCDDTKALKNKISQELFTRIFKPFYIPLLALIGGMLLIKSKNAQGYSGYKLKIFTIGVILISISEITTKFYSSNIYESFVILIMPFIFFFFILFIFLLKN